MRKNFIIMVLLFSIFTSSLTSSVRSLYYIAEEDGEIEVHTYKDANHYA